MVSTQSNYKTWKYLQNGIAILLLILGITLGSTWKERDANKSKMLTQIILLTLCANFILFLFRYVFHNETNFYFFRFRQTETLTHLFLIVFLLGFQVTTIWLTYELMSRLSSVENPNQNQGQFPFVIPTRSEMDETTELTKLNKVVSLFVVLPILFGFFDPVYFILDRIFG